MTFTFKISRRLAFISAVVAGSSLLSCTADEPSGSTAYVIAAGDTLFSDGFESGVLAWDDNYSSASKQIISGAARTGTRGLRVTFSPNSEAGTLSKFVARGDRVHVRMAVRFSSNWTGSTALLRLRAAPESEPWAAFGRSGECPTGDTWASTGTSAAGSNLDVRFSSTYVGMSSSSSDCYPTAGTSGSNPAQYSGSTSISKGVWHVVEIEAQLNTVGEANGWQRVWLDGVAVGEWTGLVFRTSSLIQWNAVGLAMPSYDVTTTQTLDIDDFVVQPQRPDEVVGAPAPAPTPETLFTESFDNTSFASRGWYDFAGTPVVTTADMVSGTGSLLIQFPAGAEQPPMRVMRKLFEPTDRLYVSYWVKYSSNYVGSGHPYHPHEFSVLSDQDQDWDGLTFNYLNTYIEQNYQDGGRPRIAIQDSRMIDASRIGVNLTNVTEQRSVGGCNGDSDGSGVTACFQLAGRWYNSKTWDATAVAFMPAPGSDYKSYWNHVEVEFKLNSVIGGIGQKDGVVRYWLNGNLKLERTNVVFRTGANPTLKFKQFLINPYIGDGSPVTQRMWIDELSVGTARTISGSTPPPPAPTPPPPAPTPPAPAPVASVSVTPSSATLEPGDNQTFNAVLRDAAGLILSGRPVTWTTSAAGVATVVGGVVTAISAGTATITAASEGRSGSAVVTVVAPEAPPPPEPTPPPTSGGTVPELPTGYTSSLVWPGSPAPPSGWPTGWSGSPSGSATVISDETAPASAPLVTRITYPVGFQSGNEPQTWEYRGTNGAAAVVFTYWFKYSSGFQGEQSYVNKHLMLFASDGTPIGYTAMRFKGTQTTGYVDWLFEQGSTGPLVNEWLATDRTNVRIDQWHRVTVEVSQGNVRLWVDGKLVGSTTSATFKSVGVLKVAPTWGGDTGDVMDTAGHLYLDEIRVHTR